VLSRTDRRVRLIGFDLEPLEGDFSDKCIRTRHVFSVWESAEVYLETKTVAAFREEYLDKSKRFYFTFVSYGSGQTYLEALERAYLMGIKVRSCYLCLHHRLLKAPQHKVAPHRIFCDYWDEAWSPTFAVDCEHYSPGKAALHIYHGGKIDQDVLENRQFYCSRGMAALLGRSIDMLEKD
jgi:hypothetical protein